MCVCHINVLLFLNLYDFFSLHNKMLVTKLFQLPLTLHFSKYLLLCYTEEERAIGNCSLNVTLIRLLILCLFYQLLECCESYDRFIRHILLTLAQMLTAKSAAFPPVTQIKIHMHMC